MSDILERLKSITDPMWECELKKDVIEAADTIQQLRDALESAANGTIGEAMIILEPYRRQGNE